MANFLSGNDEQEFESDEHAEQGGEAPDMPAEDGGEALEYSGERNLRLIADLQQVDELISTPSPPRLHPVSTLSTTRRDFIPF